ncbi:MAG: ribulose-phosphate 3-epimerase, partial [Thermoanaerobaculia bacterium]
LPALDFVLLMSVNPGFAGQAFLPYVLDKARRLAALVHARGTRVEIAMDGGLDRDNIRQAAAAGVEVAVVGSGIFAAPEPLQEMAELRARARSESV